MAQDGDHFRLAFERSGTWSQKYNRAWDRLLGLNLFPPAVARTEIADYERELRKFSWPLDSRKSYTKPEWEVCSVSLADYQSDFRKLMSPIFNFVEQTLSRVPLPDCYCRQAVPVPQRLGERLDFRLGQWLEGSS